MIPTKEINRCLLTATVVSSEKESAKCGEISRPVINALTYDTSGNSVNIRIILSSLQHIRNCSAIREGDIIKFDGCIGEFSQDEIVFYPVKIESERGDIKTSGSIVANKIKMTPNLVVFAGKIKSVYAKTVSIVAQKPSFLRGEYRKQSLITVANTDNKKLNEGDKVLFIGEMTSKGLVGEVYL